MSFFILDDIYSKLQKIYNKGEIFRDYIENSNLFPIKIKLKKVQEKDITNNYSLLLSQIKNLKKSELTIEYKEFEFKKLGKQTVPVAVIVEDVEHFCKIVDKKFYYDRFVENYHKVITKYPKLRDLILKKPMIVLEYVEHWDRIFLIIDFFINNNQQNLYLREISLKDIDTKYIEKHLKILDILISNIKQLDTLKTIGDFAFEKKYHLKYPLAQVRFRMLDERLYINGLSDLTLCIDEFEKLKIECKKVYIIENKITTLAFPQLKDSIAIFGSGYKVGILQNTKWLKDKEIFYWGDIDSDGFAILSQIRGYFPQIKSIFMDQSVFDKFSNFIVEYKSKVTNKKLEYLTNDELKLYSSLSNKRLEQERLPFEFIKGNL